MRDDDLQKIRGFVSMPQTLETVLERSTVGVSHTDSAEVGVSAL